MEIRILELQGQSTSIAGQVSECEARINIAEQQFRRYASEVQRSIRSATRASPFCTTISPLIGQISEPDSYIDIFKR